MLHLNLHNILLLTAVTFFGMINAAAAAADNCQVAGGDGTDWVLSCPGHTCVEACSETPAGPGSCNIHAMNQTNTEDRMCYVDTFVGGQCEDFKAGQVFGNEPSFYISLHIGHCVYLETGDTASCDVTFGSERKYCCCGSNCPVETPPETDWVLVGAGENCHQGCEAIGGACDSEASTNLNSLEKVEYVSSFLGNICDEYDAGAVFGNEPSFYR